MAETISLHAADISCHHCAATIKRELASVQGIVAVEVDVPTKTVRIEYETEQALTNAKELLAEIGYPVIAN